MFDQHERDGEEIVERVIHELRRPVYIDRALDTRVMNEIAQPALAEPVARRSFGRVLPWLAAAAVLGAVLIGQPWSRAGNGADAFQFVLIAPQAASVSLVGDFNDWDPSRAPMHVARGGVWATVVSLAPGRYRYAFLVDGVQWRADPSAPLARDDEFGSPSSVVTIGGRGS
ncbi:MAG TPA: isoamylase early set domain-containing protein [Gemmatimonadales bacterium]|nr:isoamylase early set domain-containing protein [Gemmatimonadales bacterium]